MNPIRLCVYVDRPPSAADFDLIRRRDRHWRTWLNSRCERVVFPSGPPVVLADLEPGLSLSLASRRQLADARDTQWRGLLGIEPLFSVPSYGF